LTNSLVTANGGGGVSFSGISLRIQHTTISNNSGSGLVLLSNKSTALIENSTISGNTLSVDFDGAGVMVGSKTTLTIANSTISGNQILVNPTGITEGGGIENLGAVTASNTIIADTARRTTLVRIALGR
jgi:hypothetical protein